MFSFLVVWLLDDFLRHAQNWFIRFNFSSVRFPFTFNELFLFFVFGYRTLLFCPVDKWWMSHTHNTYTIVDKFIQVSSAGNFLAWSSKLDKYSYHDEYITNKTRKTIERNRKKYKKKIYMTKRKINEKKIQINK